MDIELVYRTGPFIVLAAVLLGYALIEALQTRKQDWDLLTGTIVFGGGAGAVYVGSLAIGYTPFLPDPSDRWFDVVRILLWLAIIGLPTIYINVWRAFRARRRGQFRRKIIYDVHDTNTKDGLP